MKERGREIERTRQRDGKNETERLTLGRQSNKDTNKGGFRDSAIKRPRQRD